MAAAKKTVVPADFYAGSMDPDLVELEIEIGPSTVTFYGVILRILWELKENYVGESQSFTDFSANPEVMMSEEWLDKVTDYFKSLGFGSSNVNNRLSQVTFADNAKGGRSA